MRISSLMLTQKLFLKYGQIPSDFDGGLCPRNVKDLERDLEQEPLDIIFVRLFCQSKISPASRLNEFFRRASAKVFSVSSLRISGHFGPSRASVVSFMSLRQVYAHRCRCVRRATGRAIQLRRRRVGAVFENE